MTPPHLIDFVTVSEGSLGELLGRAGALALLHESGAAVAIPDDLTDLNGNSRIVSPPMFTGGSDGLLPIPREVVQGVPAVQLGYGARLISPSSATRYHVETGPVLRSLLKAAHNGSLAHIGTDILPLPSGWSLLGADSAAQSWNSRLVDRLARYREQTKADFANSAYYMGAKRGLLAFVMEALTSWVSPNATVVDLMCGSGVVAGSAARVWPTIASDAMNFCRALAGVQSGGYSRARARTLLDQLNETQQSTLDWLSALLDEPLRREALLFRSAGSHQQLTEELQQLARSVPTFPSGGQLGRWDPNTEVSKRQVEPPYSTPSCLFTAYFANLYVGLRQSIEIDAIRHAIGLLRDEDDRRWALGALVAAVSSVATAYGGHFAQPYAAADKLSASRVRRVLTLRSMSVSREFEIRLLSLAGASENIAHRVSLVPGPWRTALTTPEMAARTGPVAVYVDAPYSRDEYSRYYHVLETLVLYNYPTAVGRAKLPDKSDGGRFRSEFFTRSPERMQASLVAVLEAILERGWQCIWSYSDRGDASVPAVLRAIRGAMRVESVAAPYGYKRQGQHSSDRPVTEYLIMLEPHARRSRHRSSHEPI